MSQQSPSPSSCVHHRRSPPAALQIPELLDHTIDFLHEDKQSLASCSLTCRRWCKRATYHLFHRILITATDRGETPNKFEAFQTFLGSLSPPTSRAGRNPSHFIKHLELRGQCSFRLAGRTRLASHIRDDPEYTNSGLRNTITGATMSTLLLYSILTKLPSLQSLTFGNDLIGMYTKSTFQMSNGDQVETAWRSAHSSRLPPLKTLHVQGMRIGNTLQPFFDLLHMFSSIEHISINALVWNPPTSYRTGVESTALKLPTHLIPSVLTFNERIIKLDFILKVFSRASPLTFSTLHSLILGWISRSEAGGTEELLRVVGPRLLHLELKLSPSRFTLNSFNKATLENLGRSVRHCTRLESFCLTTTRKARNTLNRLLKHLPGILSHLLPLSLREIQLRISAFPGDITDLLAREAEVDWDTFDRILFNLKYLRKVVIEAHDDKPFAVSAVAFSQDSTKVLRKRLARVESRANILFKYVYPA